MEFLHVSVELMVYEWKSDTQPVANDLPYT